MRYALIADIHGKSNHLQRVLKHISQYPIDECICLGDVLEAKVSKHLRSSFQFSSIEQVIDMDPILLHVYEQYRTVIGNQEERVLELIPFEKLPETLQSYLTRLPMEILLNEKALVTHGHTYEWTAFDTDYFHPQIEDWKRNMIFYGHNHQNALFRAVAVKGRWRYERIEIITAAAIPLDPNTRYLVNVGDIKNSSPSWVLYDDEFDCITFHTLTGG